MEKGVNTMLLDNKCTLINQLRFDLLFDDDTRKKILIKTNDLVDCVYHKDRRKCRIVGRVSKIGFGVGSTLGRSDASVYMVIDGSDEYRGRVEHIKPNHVLDLTVLKTNAAELINPVCSVDNACQKIILVRENEVGQFQYSKDGIKWKTAGQGPHGLSAYECAVIMGFKGTEADWLHSLHGTRGPAFFHGVVINHDPCCDCDGCTCAEVYPESEVEDAIVGDKYFNIMNKCIYECVTPGDPETAAWKYLTSLMVEKEPDTPPVDPDNPDNPEDPENPPQPPSDYKLPIASETTLGGVMIGEGVDIDKSGKISMDINAAADAAADMVEDGVEEYTEAEIKSWFPSDDDDLPGA